MTLATITKDPDAVLPYSINWASEDGTNDGSSLDTGWLQSDTISSSSWSIEGPDAGLVKISDNNTTEMTTIVVSGGVVGSTYKMVNHITTAAGYEDDRTLVIKAKEK